MYRIGVDIGGTNIALGLLDEDWELLAQKSVPFQRGGETVAAIIAQQIRIMLGEAGVDEAALECIGIAVPGSITPDGQLVLDAYNLGFHNEPLRERIQAHFPGIPVALGNDADAAVLAELHKGALRGCKTAALYTIGTGIGGGFILNGKMFRGGRGNGIEPGHGVLVDVYGEGVLLMGESGVGKSETAVELVKRGHRLVADDAVEIRRISDQLIGTAPEVIRHYIELRGIGVIDVCRLFGMSAVKDEAEIDMVINLEQWKDGAMYDRLGLENLYTTILDVQVPSLTVPVRPGRNLAVIIEVAAMNNRHKKMGYNAAVEFTKQINQHFDQAMSAQLNDN